MKRNTVLPTALKLAAEAHCANQPDRAVQIICEALEDEFNRRLPQVLGVTLYQHPLPDVGVRCVQAVTQIRLERTQRRYSARQSTALLEYADLISRSMPVTTFAERICMALHRLTHLSASGRKWLLLRRILLPCLQRLSWSLLHLVPLARQHRAQVCAMLSVILSEPERRAATILRAHQDGIRRGLADSTWRHAGDGHGSRSACFVWSERAAYRKLISGSSASRVLATIHMGDFLGAFNCLSVEAEPGWQALTLVREIDEQHVAAPRVANMRQRVLRPGEYAATEIVASLRKGGHSLCILFDLREGFGGTVGVQFFGRNANSVKGPAALAIASGSPIIPFVTFYERGAPHLEMPELIDTQLRPDESFQAGVTRVTQQLMSLAENWIRRFPDQWKFLPQFPLYFDRIGQEEVEETFGADIGRGAMSPIRAEGGGP